MGRKKSAIPRPEYSVGDYVMYDVDGDKKIGTIALVMITLKKSSTDINYFIDEIRKDITQAMVVGRVVVEKKRTRNRKPIVNASAAIVGKAIDDLKTALN